MTENEAREILEQVYDEAGKTESFPSANAYFEALVEAGAFGVPSSSRAQAGAAPRFTRDEAIAIAYGAMKAEDAPTPATKLDAYRLGARRVLLALEAAGVFLFDHDNRNVPMGELLDAAGIR